jgi:hypothetical protein
VVIIIGSKNVIAQHHYLNEKVSIIGISLGGDIILETIKGKYFDNIKKVLLVCSVNEIKNIRFKHPEIINVYSKKDKLEDLAIKVFSPIHGGEKLTGKNVKNIVLPSMDHKDFCYDNPICTGKYKGIPITSLVISLIEK